MLAAEAVLAAAAVEAAVLAARAAAVLAAAAVEAAVLAARAAAVLAARAAAVLAAAVAVFAAAAVLAAKAADEAVLAAAATALAPHRTVGPTLRSDHAARPGCRVRCLTAQIEHSTHSARTRLAAPMSGWDTTAAPARAASLCLAFRVACVRLRDRGSSRPYATHKRP
ncbi:hypothetical protein ACFFX1_29190 [Dactylosporangium sucinum]|uniref:hypothetical protein n=1 Tax=Dactylosporangium sucinum TaxID=1424081 RepID=UPI00167E8E97|nr:hypothetical protein [Dactylosporangium sucinum]